MVPDFCAVLVFAFLILEVVELVVPVCLCCYFFTRCLGCVILSYFCGLCVDFVMTVSLFMPLFVSSSCSGLAVYFLTFYFLFYFLRLVFFRVLH